MKTEDVVTTLQQRYDRRPGAFWTVADIRRELGIKQPAVADRMRSGTIPKSLGRVRLDKTRGGPSAHIWRKSHLNKVLVRLRKARSQ